MKYRIGPTMEMEFKLKQSYENTRTIVHTTDAENLDVILEEFQMFLEGCGFKIDGTLSVVSDEELYGTNIRTDYSMD